MLLTSDEEEECEETTEIVETYTERIDDNTVRTIRKTTTINSHGTTIRTEILKGISHCFWWIYYCFLLFYSVTKDFNRIIYNLFIAIFWCVVWLLVEFLTLYNMISTLFNL